MARKPKDSTEDDLDMTPMVDIVFQLIIFFMVTASFSLQKSLEVPPMEEEETAEPRPLEDFEEDPQTVIVRIDGDNIFWVAAPGWTEEREAPSVQDLMVNLRAARNVSSGTPPNKLLVMASPDAIHEKVISAIDGGAEVGMDQVQLATDHEN
jgi:biopolymer transport protein ExbD